MRAMAAVRDYEYQDEAAEAGRRRARRSDYRRPDYERPDHERVGGPAIPGTFWLGAGIGLLFATAAVVTAVQFSHRQRRPRQPGTEDDLLYDLTESVQEGLGVLSQAAQHLGYSFENARRELVRFGLDPLLSGISGAGGAGNFSSSDDPTSPLYDEDGAPEEWQGASSSWDEDDSAAHASGNGSAPSDDETHGED